MYVVHVITAKQPDTSNSSLASTGNMCSVGVFVSGVCVHSTVLVCTINVVELDICRFSGSGTTVGACAALRVLCTCFVRNDVF